MSGQLACDGAADKTTANHDDVVAFHEAIISGIYWRAPASGDMRF
jgi:hypothetical protein